MLALSLLVNMVVLCLFFFVLMPQTSLSSQNESGVINFENSDYYVLYIGTNDKDTDEALLSVEEAQAIVNGISQKYTDGFTSLTAWGHWNSPQNTWVSEDTLIYLYYGVSEDDIVNIADEVVAELNQYSVMIEYGMRNIAYYPPQSQ